MWGWWKCRDLAQFLSDSKPYRFESSQAATAKYFSRRKKSHSRKHHLWIFRAILSKSTSYSFGSLRPVLGFLTFDFLVGNLILRIKRIGRTDGFNELKWHHKTPIHSSLHSGYHQSKIKKERVYELSCIKSQNLGYPDQKKRAHKFQELRGKR